MGPPHSHKTTLVKSASIISSLTLISRVLGYVRDAVIGFVFGGNRWYTDIFFLSFEIPNLFRRLLGEGALSASFISVFTEYLTIKDKKSAWSFASNVINLLAILVIILIVLGIIFTPLIIYILIPGFRNNTLAITTAIKLTRIMFPYLGFIAFAALFMGLLNSLRHFAVPASTPIFLNIAMISSALFLTPFFGNDPAKKLTALAIGVIVGGFLQVAVQVPVAFAKGMEYSFQANLRDPGVQKICRMLLPALFGLAVTQINLAIDKICASYIGEGSISYLFFGNRLVELPESIFGIAISVAVLPLLATFAAKKEYSHLTETLSYGLRLTMFLIIPASIGLCLLRVPIIKLLFERGAFTAQATQGAAFALLFYSIGLFSFCAVKLIVPVYYALQDVWTPVKIGFLAVVANIILNIILMFPLKHGGLALATTISSTINWVLLLSVLRRRVGKLGLSSLIDSFLRVLVASVLMGIVCYFLRSSFFIYSHFAFAHSQKIVDSLAILMTIFISAFIYFISAKFLNLSELNDILSVFLGKIKQT